MVTHDTPATFDTGPNSLKISKSALFERSVLVVSPRSDPRAKTVKCVGKKNAGANQAQKRCNCLNHRKDPFRPGGERTTCRLAQSKGFPGQIEDRARLMLSYNRFAQPLIHHLRLSPFPPCSGCDIIILDAVVGCIWAYSRRAPSGRHAAGGMVIGAD